MTVKRSSQKKAKQRNSKKSISTRGTKEFKMSKGDPDGDGVEQYLHVDKKRPYK